MSNLNQYLLDPEFIRWVKHPEEGLDSYWNAYIKANPGKLPDILLAREFVLGIQSSDPTEPVDLRDEILRNILRDFELSEISAKDKYPSTTTSVRNLGLAQFARIAAVILLAFGLTLGYFIVNSSLDEQPTAAKDDTLIKSTKKGEKLRLILPDSSVAWLNSESSIEFPKKFNNDERKISLTGEAFFNVKKDISKPFKVESGGLVTTALGTSFNVKTSMDGHISISLVEGRVKIEGGEIPEPYYLDPKQSLKYNGDASYTHVDTFDVKKASAWKDGTIIFEKSSLPEVVLILENWFGVEISVESPRRFRWSVSGEFTNESLENILRSLSYIEKFDYTINGKQINLKPKVYDKINK